MALYKPEKSSATGCTNDVVDESLTPCVAPANGLPVLVVVLPLPGPPRAQSMLATLAPPTTTPKRVTATNPRIGVTGATSISSELHRSLGKYDPRDRRPCCQHVTAAARGST